MTSSSKRRGNEGKLNKEKKEVVVRGEKNDNKRWRTVNNSERRKIR